MGFANSVVGGVTLVRPAIRSPNYVAGVSGWSINITGDAEFNNAVIRGSLVIGTSPFPVYEIVGATGTPAIPAELQTQYGGTLIAAALLYFTATNYDYTAYDSAGFVYTGRRTAGPTFIEAYRTISSGVPILRLPPTGIGFDLTATPTTQIFSGSAGVLDIQGDTQIRFGTIANAQADVYNGAVSQARGYSNYVSDSASSANVTAETAVLVLSSCVFASTRTYRITFGNRLDTSNANGRARLRLRKTSTAAGTLWVDFGTVLTSATAGEDGPATGTGILRRTAGTDLTTDICLTLEHLAGGANTARLVASAALPSWIYMEDIGASSDFPGAVDVT